MLMFLLGVPNHRCNHVTPLHLAARGGHLKVMDELLDPGANIDARTNGACGFLVCLNKILQTHLLQKFTINFTSSRKPKVPEHQYSFYKAGKTLSERKWRSAFTPEGHLDIARRLYRIQPGVSLDVVRTDRTLVFYEKQEHLLKLWDILAVYAWIDKDVGYCQGVSDLCSPMIIFLEDEADGFWCFERLMRRLVLTFTFINSNLSCLYSILLFVYLVI
ncbi:hypothetical protein AQUCO_09000001v1 [Aquilegia coerulea]|uniref:Rab-GAP TBC domain-containing protein n=1 Tax=Aquilegia coerulea TaxID=218851 RepID=A0A2G5C620_AQUCA|nr:hypothetical protein AQUCO_09000001v1 [Aquilegia coerulea]